MNIVLWAKRIKSGDTQSLAQAITLIESKLDSDQVMANRLLRRCVPVTRESVRVGITGPPGAGKSSFIEFIGNELLKIHPRKIAVLTIDPSSPDQGGSILGDKTRMQTLAQQPGVFIRPSPSKQHPGGVHAQTRKSIQLCEYSGYTTILIETVGVGQSELSVNDITDLTLLIIPPAGGDELQGIKKGITEIADLIVVNKNDSGLESQVKYTQSQYKSAVHLRSGKEIKVFKCSSLLKSGFDAIWKEIQYLILERKKTGQWGKNRSHQRLIWFNNTLQNQWMRELDRIKDLKTLKKIQQKLVKSHVHVDVLALQYMAKLKKLTFK